MDVCPAFFSQPFQLPLSPNIIGFDTYVPGIPLDINFDKSMDQTSTPPVTTFEVVVDGSPETPTLLSWQSATKLRVTFTGVPTVSGVLNQLVQTAALRGLDGSVVKLPQSVTFFP